MSLLYILGEISVMVLEIFVIIKLYLTLSKRNFEAFLKIFFLKVLLLLLKTQNSEKESMRVDSLGQSKSL